jgi:hypothetical protein
MKQTTLPEHKIDVIRIYPNCGVLSGTLGICGSSSEEPWTNFFSGATAKQRAGGRIKYCGETVTFGSLHRKLKLMSAGL